MADASSPCFPGQTFMGNLLVHGWTHGPCVAQTAWVLLWVASLPSYSWEPQIPSTLVSQDTPMLWEGVPCWYKVTVPSFGLVSSPLQQGRVVAVLAGTLSCSLQLLHSSSSEGMSQHNPEGRGRAELWAGRCGATINSQGLRCNPKIFLFIIYYPIFLNIFNCLVGSQVGSSAEPPQHETIDVWRFLQSWRGRCCLPKEGRCVFCKHLHRVLPLSMVMDLQTPASGNRFGMSELFVSPPVARQ